MSRQAIFGASLLAAALGAALGYGFATATAPVLPAAAPPQRDPELADALGDLAARLAAIERSLAERTTTVRQRAAQPDPEASVPSEPSGATEALLERLTAIARDLAIVRADREHEILRRTREANPQPNEAAVRVLHAALVAEEGLSYAQRTTRRDWTLRTMAEVVAHLGVPTAVFAGGTGPVWEYHFDDESVTVTFRDGLVVDVND